MFLRGCVMVCFGINLQRLNLIKVQERNFMMSWATQGSISLKTVAIFFSSCSNPNMTTNASQAEIPTELRRAEASPAPQVGTTHFTSKLWLTGSLVALSATRKNVLLPSQIRRIRKSLLKASDSPRQGESWFICGAGATKSNWTGKEERTGLLRDRKSKTRSVEFCLLRKAF